MPLLSDRTITRQEKKAGGKGHVISEPLLSETERNDKCSIYSQITLEPGCSIGYHEHHGESESYHILEGSGTYSDNGKDIPVKAGDLTFCPDGEGHALENTASQGNLVFVALVLKN